MGKIVKDLSDLCAVMPQDKTLTLVGGCFDLLHVGHISLLEYASRLEDLLVVAVLSDDNIRGYKGSERSIINEEQRVKMVASMQVVDYVYISNINPNGPETISFLKPNSIVFGGDINKDKLKRWARIIKCHSPETNISIFPRDTKEGMSTSKIIKKIRRMIM